MHTMHHKRYTIIIIIVLLTTPTLKYYHSCISASDTVMHSSTHRNYWANFYIFYSYESTQEEKSQELFKIVEILVLLDSLYQVQVFRRIIQQPSQIFGCI